MQQPGVFCTENTTEYCQTWVNLMCQILCTVESELSVEIQNKTWGKKRKYTSFTSLHRWQNENISAHCVYLFTSYLPCLFPQTKSFTVGSFTWHVLAGKLPPTSGGSIWHSEEGGGFHVKTRQVNEPKRLCLREKKQDIPWKHLSYDRSDRVMYDISLKVPCLWFDISYSDALWWPNGEKHFTDKT